MIQVASCEQAFIKTNRKPIENYQTKSMFLLKRTHLNLSLTDTRDRHPEHCQGMQSGLPVFAAGELGAFKIFTVLQSLIFWHFSNWKRQK